jgi:hypothetical protein
VVKVLVRPDPKLVGASLDFFKTPSGQSIASFCEAKRALKIVA